MKKLRNIVIAGCSVLLLCQCASKGEVRQMDRQIRAVNQKVEDVKSKTSNQVQKGQASSVNKIDSLTNETRQLRALLEESNQRNQKMIEQTTENLIALQQSLEQFRQEDALRIKELEASVDQLAGGLTRVKQARVQAAERRAREAARKAAEARKRTVIAANAADNGKVVLRPSAKKVRKGTGAVQPAVSQTRTAAPQAGNVDKTVAAASPVAPSSAPKAGSSLFNNGIASFKSGKYSEAYKTFEQVMSSNPQGAKAAHTQFYMGECLYNQGEYDLAILDYQKVISNHPKDPRTPAAMLKQGMSFEKLTDHETAKIIYQKLIVSYKSSSEAGLATKRLKKL